MRKSNARCPWLTVVVAHMNRYRRPYTIAEIVARFQEPEGGITAEKKVSSACGAGYFVADKTGSVTLYTATGKVYGNDAPEPEFKAVAGLGYGPRYRSVFDLAQGAQA